MEDGTGRLHRELSARAALRDGVVIDCGRMETGQHVKGDEDWWLDLYVMLSRATRLEDILLLRSPDLEFFAGQPHKSLQKHLGKFARRSEECRRTAEQLAGELGFGSFLRPE